jgi:uncharacterized protein DUF4236
LRKVTRATPSRVSRPPSGSKIVATWGLLGSSAPLSREREADGRTELFSKGSDDEAVKARLEAYQRSYRDKHEIERGGRSSWPELQVMRPEKPSGFSSRSMRDHHGLPELRRQIMGFRFRQSIKIIPGVRLNLSKTGHSWSFGLPGFTVNTRKGRARTTLSLPGAGLSYVTESRNPTADQSNGGRLGFFGRIGHRAQIKQLGAQFTAESNRLFAQHKAECEKITEV